MAKALLGDLRVDAGGQHLRRMAVAQIVEPDPGEGCLAEDPHPLVRERTRLQRACIGLCHDKRGVVEPNTQPEMFFRLTCSQASLTNRCPVLSNGVILRDGR
ncbi:hypothetical protein [Mesorhizobium caraganae]|uniref:hypothetical protein n=1 Tax=Mesorhizobium caraganae TaxID=483206 RepID=UPI003DA0651D